MVMNHAGQPRLLRTSKMYPWSTLGEAASKSKKTAAASSSSRAACAIASSMSTTLASIERPRRKPRCVASMPGATMGSTCRRMMLHRARLSVLVMFRGRVLDA